MKRARAIAFLLIAVIALRVHPAAGEGINLSWGDCGTHGTEIRSFACGTNTGLDELIVSFVPPPGVNLLRGLEAEVLVESPTDLPDWWMHGSQLCRGVGSLTASFDFTSSAGSCADPWQGQASGGSVYEAGYGGPNRARIRVVTALAAGLEGPADAGTEYYAFRIRLSHQKTTGSGSCAGCTTPVSLTLNSIQLDQPPSENSNPLITTPLNDAVAYWQNTFGPLPEIQSMSPGAGAVGTPVTLTGARLGPVTSVRFNTVEAAFTVISDMEIQTSVPAGGRTGLLHVQSPEGIGNSSASFVVAPEISSFSPPRAAVGNTVTINGINFTATQAVEFNGTSAVFSVENDTRILAAVPQNATDGPIRVVNAGGSDVSDEDFQVGPVPIPGGGAINLSWDDCGIAGAALKSFACSSNSGSPFLLFGSFGAPENIFELTGMTATLEIVTSEEALPDWWRHGSGQCRGLSALGSSLDFTAGPYSCIDPWEAQAVGGHVYEVGYGGVDRARLRVIAALPPGTGGPLTAGSQYYAFRVSFSRAKTIGTGSCPGCAAPACITLQQIQLIQDPGRAYDPVITYPGDRNYVHWQGETGTLTCPSSTPPPPPPLGVINSTAPKLTIDRIIPARAGREITLALTLVSDEEARVEIFDARGRRLGSRALDGLRAGKQEVTVSRGTSLPSGIYFARVIQGSRSAARAFAVKN